jgi:superfamily II DNA/RNA helicase
MDFSELHLSENVLRAVADAGYKTPTPIQEQAIPCILTGRDVLGCAQTGTGKTASFTLPMIHILAAGRAKARMPRSLILEPTRELAAQVADNFEAYGKYSRLNKALLIGGESMAEQLKVLDRGADVLIATPGRLLDVFDRGRLLLNDIRILVIDEADRMLDMGFIPDVERIVSLVSRMRQTLFFSATMPPAIRRLADAFLNNPKEITIAPPATPAATVDQGLLVISPFGREGLSAQKEKRAALRRLIDSEEVRNALIFCNRKRDVGIVYRSLARHGYDAAQLHGDMAQSARTEVLDRFKKNDVRLLVCSDVAARGLDIEDLSHVFNYDIPSNPEDYVHRIGRTGRAGRSGRALSVALSDDSKYVQLIEKLIGRAIPRLTVDGLAPAELQPFAGKGRRRRPGAGDKGPSRPAVSGRQPAQPTAPSTAETGPVRAAAPNPQGRRSRPALMPQPRPPAPSPRGPREPDKPVVGMGDHVPAFLLRDITVRKKA